MDSALSAIGDADLILFVLDVASPDPASEYFLVRRLQEQQRPVLLALNKIDLIEKSALLEIIRKWSTEYHFDVIVPISATEGTQIENLIEAMENLLPYGPPYFPEDALTDLPQRFIAAEMARYIEGCAIVIAGDDVIDASVLEAGKASVITSYSIHYTKLYDNDPCMRGLARRFIQSLAAPTVSSRTVSVFAR